MNQSSGPAPGWYDDPSSPGFERWWDGSAWGQQRPAGPTGHDHPVPPQPVAAPASPDVKSGGTGCFGIATGVMFGIVGAMALVLVGCVALIAANTDSGDGVVLAETGDGDDEVVAGPETGSDEADVGTRENPLPLGTAHSRKVGLTGTGWDISIDEVQWVELGQFAESGETGNCLVIAGTATAREVETDDGLSNIFSFPEIIAVVDGVQLNPVDAFPACDAQPTGFEDHLTSTDMSFAEGGSGKWVKPFHVAQQDASLDWIAVEEVIYAVE